MGGGKSEVGVEEVEVEFSWANVGNAGEAGSVW
jgi:hypothetical protein